MPNSLAIIQYFLRIHNQKRRSTMAFTGSQFVVIFKEKLL